MGIKVRSGLIGVAATLLLLGAVLGISQVAVYAQSQPAPGCITGYEAPRISASMNELRAVSFSSPDNGWAVGSYTGPSPVTLYALHWNGREWSLAAMPSPGTRSRDVRDVAAVSPFDAWAVGYYSDGDVTYTLTMRWDGRLWRHVPITGLGNLGALNGVAAVTSNDVWAVGSFHSPDTNTQQSIILHWDGAKWTPADLPRISERDNVLSAISAYSANDIWAVGTDYGKPLLLHWDGRTWTRAASPEFMGTARLSDVVAMGPNGAWAVGGSSDGPFITRWNGATWSKLSAPAGSGGFPGSLDSIAAVSPNDIWAVGNSNVIARGQDNRQLLVVRWTGQTWITITVPIAEGNASAGAGVAVTPRGEVWIVGAYFDFVRQSRVPLIRQVKNPPCAPTSPTSVPSPPSPTRAVPLEPPAQVPGNNSVTFPETGKTVKGLFLDYWQSHGGLAQQGYPISNVMGEVSDLNGRIYTVQYFERAVFEYHPENQAPYNVLLSQLGTFEYRKKYPNGAPGQKPNQDPGTRFFPETGKRLGGAFHHYWLNHGGLMQQGYPISDEFVEISPLDGKPYTVQYFERAVFEYHPENRGTQFEVLLSHLGRFRYNSRYGQPVPPVTPVVTPGPPPPALKQLPGAEVVGGKYVFWRTAHGQVSSIDGYDLEQNRQFQVTVSATNKEYIASDGRTVVWNQDCPPHCHRIRAYDLATNWEYAITEPAPGRTYGKLYLDRGKLYYQRNDAGGSGLYEYNLSNGQERMIYQGGFGIYEMFQPVIKDGMLLWSQASNNGSVWRLYMRRVDSPGGEGDRLIATTTTSFTSYDASGDNIVWSVYPLTPTEPRMDPTVFAYNISTRTSRTITGNMTVIPFIKNNIVVWSARVSAGTGPHSSLQAYDLVGGTTWTVVPDRGTNLRIVGIADGQRVVFTEETASGVQNSYVTNILR